MGKSSQQEQKVELPKEVREQANKNMELARQVGQLPYAPNFGMQVAAFSPMQESGFQNTSTAASAFGLPSGGGMAGMPTPETGPGGMRGYSTRGVYEDAMSKVNPKILELYNSFFAPAVNAAQGGGGAATPSHANKKAGTSTGQPVAPPGQIYGNPERSWGIM